MDDQEATRAERTRPNAPTREEEAREARATPDAGRPPTEDEERAADRNPAVAPEVVEHYEEMTERGAHQQGEGRIP